MECCGYVCERMEQELLAPLLDIGDRGAGQRYQPGKPFLRKDRFAAFAGIADTPAHLFVERVVVVHARISPARFRIAGRYLTTAGVKCQHGKLFVWQTLTSYLVLVVDI